MTVLGGGHLRTLTRETGKIRVMGSPMTCIDLLFTKDFPIHYHIGAVQFQEKDILVFKKLNYLFKVS